MAASAHDRLDERRIETGRLLLTPHTADDWDDCAALWADPEVTRFIAAAPLSREECWTRLLRYAGHWALLGYGYWAVREKGSLGYVGDVGIADHRRDMTPALTVPEVGWVLNGRFQGRGYGLEAVEAALQWSDVRLAAPKTCCIIRPGHERSLQLAAKVGFVRVETALYHERPTQVLERLNPFGSDSSGSVRALA